MEDKKYSSIHYHNYLQLDKVLDAQDLRSEEVGKPAHDEMLFIIIHQVYELWFKQIIHEMKSIMNIFQQEKVPENEIGKAVHRIRRITEIQKVMIDQINVLETMTPLDFLDFRNYLIPASGFQSYQFRVAEVAMGLKPEMRTTYNQKVYSKEFTEEQQKYLNDLENGDSLFDLVDRWLSRTPFIKLGDFNFKKKYLEAVSNMTEKEKETILETSFITDQDKEIRVKMLEQNKEYIEESLDKEKHAKSIEEGTTRLSYKATVAALMIRLYRDESILRTPYQFIDSLVQMDEQFTLFRYRHAQMVMRILGKRMGTGGSSGYEYLMRTVLNHQIFRDLHNISTLMIPRSELPELPEDIRKSLDFVYNS